VHQWRSSITGGGVQRGADQIGDEDGSTVRLDNDEEEELQRKHELNW
jgi:hypothetical protein